MTEYTFLQGLVWLLVSLLYLGTAVWVQVRYHQLHTSVTLAMFFIGAAVFVGANRRLFFWPELQPVAQLVILAFLVLGWAAGAYAIRMQIKWMERVNFRELLAD